MFNLIVSYAGRFTIHNIKYYSYNVYFLLLRAAAKFPPNCIIPLEQRDWGEPDLFLRLN